MTVLLLPQLLASQFQRQPQSTQGDRKLMVWRHGRQGAEHSPNSQFHGNHKTLDRCGCSSVQGTFHKSDQAGLEEEQSQGLASSSELLWDWPPHRTLPHLDRSCHYLPEGSFAWSVFPMARSPGGCSGSSREPGQGGQLIWSPEKAVASQSTQVSSRNSFLRCAKTFWGKFSCPNTAEHWSRGAGVD